MLPTWSRWPTLDLRRTRWHIGHSAGVARSRAALLAPGPRSRCENGVDQRRDAEDDPAARSNAGALPKEVFDGFRASLVANRGPVLPGYPGRSAFFRLQPNRSEGLRRQCSKTDKARPLMGSIKAQFDCIKAMSENLTSLKTSSRLASQRSFSMAATTRSYR